MTTTATEEYVPTQDDIDHKQACAALKARLKTLAENQAYRKEGYRESQKRGDSAGASSAYPDRWRSDITILHIVHNRLRHEKPHTGSVEKDAEFLNKTSINWVIDKHIPDEHLKAVKRALRNQREEAAAA